MMRRLSTRVQGLVFSVDFGLRGLFVLGLRIEGLVMGVEGLGFTVGGFPSFETLKSPGPVGFSV